MKAPPNNNIPIDPGNFYPFQWEYINQLLLAKKEGKELIINLGRQTGKNQIREYLLKNK